MSESENNEIKSKWSLEKFLEENPPDENGTIICPKCLGKGDVDNDDIKRLSMGDNLIPGVCLYCNGFGLVNIEKIDSSKVDQKIYDIENNITDIQKRNFETLVSLSEKYGDRDPFDDEDIDESPIRPKDGAGIR